MSEEQLEEICSELKMQNVHLSALVKHFLMPENHEQSDINLSKEGTVLALMQRDIFRKLANIEAEVDCGKAYEMWEKLCHIEEATDFIAKAMGNNQLRLEKEINLIRDQIRRLESRVIDMEHGVKPEED